MKLMHPNRKTARVLMLSAAIATTQAGDKDFADSPLFLQSGVKPNIMFGVDDSGSMSWETVIPNSLKEKYAWPFPSWWMNDSSGIDPTPEMYDPQDIIRSCAGTNLMYYNPNSKYTPWVGKNSWGDAFADATLTDIDMNPFYPDSWSRDLTDVDNDEDDDPDTNYYSGYFPWFDHNGNEEWDFWYDRDKDGEIDIWVDSNNDGVVQANETELECPAYFIRENGSNKIAIPRATLDAWFVTVTEMTTADKQNFANWYQYYRKRQYVAKRALSSIVTDSIARMGLATLWDNSGVFTEVKNVDDISTPVNLTNQSNKNYLLRNIFRISTGGGTPVRRQLKQMGRYFETGEYYFDYRDDRDDGDRTFASPILGEDAGGQCQQNFLITFSDGQWNGGSPDVGDTDTVSNSEFDGGYYADKNTDADGKGVSDTMADVAMHYYERDLRPSYDNIVPTIEGTDENPAQHLVTYTVAFGVSGTLDDDIAPDSEDFAGWPTPYKDQPTTIDDMRHAAYNGRGLYLNAQNSQELIDSLNDSIQDIQDRTGSASTVAVNSGSYSSLATVFQAQFSSLDWTGRLRGKPLSYNASTGQLVAGTPVLASVVPGHDERNIATYDGDSGVAFEWASLNDYQQEQLKQDGEDADGENLLNYIRGDKTLEGETSSHYRQRDVWNKACDTCPVDTRAISHLGDIINSTPTYVGEPQYRYPDDLEEGDYSDFRKDPDGDEQSVIMNVAGEAFKFRRKPMLYVGANDGMLHGFVADPHPDAAADFGKEVFAYVPNAVIPRLHRLADQNYRHHYTVDGSPYVGDAYFGDEWRTVLVSGLNSGGQGIFAIDVTKPQNFTSAENVAAAVLWEFNDDADLYDSDGDDDADASDLGFTYGKPIIAKANNGDWVAIFGNGYNNTYGDSYPGSGNAVLYIVRLSDGTLLKKIDTGVNDLEASNGLSSPTTADVDGDFKADYVYAGDLEGNLWKFDISSETPSEWDVAFGTDTNKKPLYTACGAATCSDTNRQPITAKPEVILNKAAHRGYLVFFGTGSYVFDPDLDDTSKQSLYGIWDKYEDTLVAFNRSHLLQQEILSEKNFGNAVSPNWQREVSSYPLSWHSGDDLPTDGADDDRLVDTQLGWVVDLIIDDDDSSSEDEYLGERSIVGPVVRGSAVDFNTLIPNDDPCSAGGDGWVMRINPFTGGALQKTPVIDANQDGVVNEADRVNFDASSQDPDAGASGDATPSGGFKVQDLSGALGECVYMVLPDGKEVCILPEEEHYSRPTQALGRWTWREL